MTTHDLRGVPTEDRYGDSVVVNARLVIAGAHNGSTGYGLLVVPEGREGRREFGGPMVPGPWAAAFGLAGVIDNYGGTGAEIAREKAEGRYFAVEPGDRLLLPGGLEVTVEVNRRRDPKLNEEV